MCYDLRKLLEKLMRDITNNMIFKVMLGYNILH